jgi:hypothetical protein
VKKIILSALMAGIFVSSASFAGSFYSPAEHRKAQVNRRWSIQPLCWHEELDGHFKIVENKDPARGQRIDLGRDAVNLDKENTFGVNCSYQVSHRGKIEFNCVNAKHDGNLGIARMFKGKNYNANSKFKIDNNIYDLLFNYDLCHSIHKDGKEKYYFGGIFGVKASDFDFGISGQVLNQGAPAVTESTSYSETLPVPYVGFEYGTFIGKLYYFKAGIRYMGLNIKDYDATHYDYNLAFSYQLSGDDCLHDLMMDVGYRYINYDVEGKGNDIDLSYKGPYLSFNVLF